MSTNVLITGSSGALGAHSILRLKELGFGYELLDLRNPALDSKMSFDHVLHLAGVNRGSELEVEQGNVFLAELLVSQIDKLPMRPKSITFANSTQALNPTNPYGRGKRAASDLLSSWVESHLIDYRNLFIPNLIGEFGKPFQNMVGSTITHCLALGIEMPSMSNNKFPIATISSAADLICDFDSVEINLKTSETSAKELAEVAAQIFSSMQLGIDDYGSHPLGSSVWSMLVSELFGRNKVRQIEKKRDSRGSFSEIFKAQGLDQQVSVIDFEPKALRGNHFHRQLVEDFFVLSGCVEVFFGKAWVPGKEAERIILNPGESIRFPIGWWHALQDQTEKGSQVLVRGQRIYNPKFPDTIHFG